MGDAWDISMPDGRACMSVTMNWSLLLGDYSAVMAGTTAAV
jgi:hypothetical protein